MDLDDDDEIRQTSLLTIDTTEASAAEWINCRICKHQIHLDDLPEHVDCSSINKTPTGTTGGSSNDKTTPLTAIVTGPSTPRTTTVLPPLLLPSSPPSPPPRSPDGKSRCKTADAMRKNLLCLTCTISDVRMSDAPGGYAIYVIKTSVPADGMEYHTERRYSDFYRFATQLDTIYPLQDLWTDFPPKTYCCQQSRQLQPDFLHTRRESLENFLSGVLALNQLSNSSDGPTQRSSVGQLFALQQFLDVPSPIDLKIAFADLKQHAAQSSDWNKVYEYGGDGGDCVFEKYIDGCLALQRTKTLRASAQSVFQLLMLKPDEPDYKRMCPWVVNASVLRRRSKHTWIEHSISKSIWPLRYRETVRLKSWRVSSDDKIYIVSIPAESADWPTEQQPSSCARMEQHILAGWIIAPTPDKSDECRVTWITQGSYGGGKCASSWLSKTILWSRAEQLSNVEALLLASGGSVNADKTLLVMTGSDEQAAAAVAPKYLEFCKLAFEIEPEALFVIHKNQNKNVVVVKRNPDGVVVANWLLFQKAGHPSKNLTRHDRNSLYRIKSRDAHGHDGAVTLDMHLLRDRTVTLRPMQGRQQCGVFCKIGDEPDAQLKRIYLRFASTLPGAQLVAIDIWGETGHGTPVSETQSLR